MALPNFEIHVSTSRESYVKMNGELLPGVRGVTVTNSVGEVPRVIVDFYSTDVEVTVDGEQIALRIEPAPGAEMTTLNDAFRQSYVSREAE